MAEITKRETRNRGERRPVVTIAETSRAASSTLSKTLKRKSPEPLPEPEPLRSRDPPNLPSANALQEDNLSDTQWKSVAESGVLAASLKQSMEKWRSGGCFEKYYVKNPKKKAHMDFQNPPIQSMVKLGSAMLVIEPHSFEVLMYSVKATAPPSIQPPSKHKPSFNTAIPPYKHPPQSPATLQPASASATSQTNTSTATGASPASIAKAPVGTPGNLRKLAPGSSIEGKSAESSSSANNTPKQSHQTSASDPSSNNPVIKELALRASQNAELKELMKTVAGGGASELQLKEFQRHIDDINAMLKSKSASDAPLPKSKTGSAKNQASNDVRQNQPIWTKPITPNLKSESGAIFQQAPISSSKSRPLVASGTQSSAVVFEIASGTGDRYLIPKKSLLEFRNGHRLAILSFLVHLKGSSANGGFYEDDKEYCELITLKLFADRPEVLEPLRRAVDSPEAVRKQMQDWAEKMSVAEKAYLVLRMRSSIEDEDSRLDRVVPAVKDEAMSSEYDAPNSLFPLHRPALVARS